MNIEEKINQLKQLLAESDYKAIKHSEGLISEEDYIPIKSEREMWRKTINELEEKLIIEVPTYNESEEIDNG